MATPGAHGRCVPQPELPHYLFHYPCFKKVQLSAVKEQTFHPNLPTFRAMDRDTVMCKLSDDHCQSTTCCTYADFAEAAITASSLPVARRYCFDITETGRSAERWMNTAESIQRSSAMWSRYVNNPELFKARPEDVLMKADNYDVKHFHFDGAKIRRILPDNRDRRMTLTFEPRLDPHGYGQQQPTPSEIKSRYRHTQPIFYRDMSSKLWRDTDLWARPPKLPA